MTGGCRAEPRRGEAMQRGVVPRLTATLYLVAHVLVVLPAGAQDTNLAAGVSAVAASVIATGVAAPVRLLACGATVLIGGIAYGLTMGTSELVRQELAAGTKDTCGGTWVITPEEVTRATRDPQARM